MRKYYAINENGWTDKKLQYIFSGIKQRCYNKNSKSYNLYGGRGIIICEEWLNNPQNFNDWAIISGWKPGLTIDRIDSDGNYCPENCRWVTKEENGRHIKQTIFITTNEMTKSLREWSKYLGFGVNTISYIYKHYGEAVTVELINLRLLDKNKKSRKGESWLSIYGINI